MASVFTNFSARSKTRMVEQYLFYLLEQDGAPDFIAGTLPKREECFHELESRAMLHQQASEFAEDFKRTVESRSATGASQISLWMAAVSRVQMDLDRVSELRMRARSSTETTADRILSQIFLQYRYSARAFDLILRTLGTDRRPPGNYVSMILLEIIGRVPGRFVYPMLLAGSLTAVVFISELRRIGAKLFAESTAVNRQILFLLDQVLISEIGHVTFSITQMTSLQISIARSMIPALARGLARDPYTSSLFDLRILMQDIGYMDWDSIPHEIIEKAFVAE